MIANILVAAAFMVLELFIIQKWLQKREKTSNSIAWAPFRKMLLDGIVRFSDTLTDISVSFERSVTAQLDAIRNTGKLSREDHQRLLAMVRQGHDDLIKARRDFYYIVQTVAPSMQPYAAQYCSEVLWFCDAVEGRMNKATEFIKDITETNIDDIKHVSHQLNGVKAMVLSIQMFRDMRFAQFKSNFTQSVWKKENLHYFEEDGHGEFLEPHDYYNATETQKSVEKLKAIPRTAPIKSFFDPD